MRARRNFRRADVFKVYEYHGLRGASGRGTWRYASQRWRCPFCSLFIGIYGIAAAAAIDVVCHSGESEANDGRPRMGHRLGRCSAGYAARQCAAGLIFVAAAIEVLRIGVEMAMRGVEQYPPAKHECSGWAYWLPMCVLLIVGSGSYLLLETGFRRLLLVAGRVGNRCAEPSVSFHRVVTAKYG